MIKSVNLFKSEVGILWEDYMETYIPYSELRSFCPCAFCSGESDVFGNKYGGENMELEKNIEIVKFEKVGYYGLQFFFSDGHKDGIYTFDLLKKYHSKKITGDD